MVSRGAVRARPLGARVQCKPWLQLVTVNMLDLIPDDTPCPYDPNLDYAPQPSV